MNHDEQKSAGDNTTPCAPPISEIQEHINNRIEYYRTKEQKLSYFNYEGHHMIDAILDELEALAQFIDGE